MVKVVKTQKPDNRFKSLDYSKRMVAGVLVATYIRMVQAAGSSALKQMGEGQGGASTCRKLWLWRSLRADELPFESFCNTVRQRHLFSTVSVDKSVGKLFTRPSIAAAVVFAADWLKINQSMYIHIYQ